MLERSVILEFGGSGEAAFFHALDRASTHPEFSQLSNEAKLRCFEHMVDMFSEKVKKEDDDD